MADSLTEGLKRAAPHWSLAGDKQLLDVLQGLHQKIIEKCQETNRNLEKMVTALDEASIHLQNVNNKFTALSNSQFIESRVFDDDGVDQTEVEKPKEQIESKEENEIDIINRGLQVLERMHESVTILCDSDSESGSDDEEVTRVVLKPKDLYADRPLPYIIGSKAWKSKWHAGLLPDESDSDSASAKEIANNEEYSDSEPEPISETPRRLAAHRRSPTISSSSNIESEEEVRPPNIPLPPSQSDVAAELARRLGGGTTKLPEAEPEDLPPSPAVRKVYKPHKPTPGNVFLDEPPPIDSDQSEDDDDIFAEINKKQPYRQNIKADNSVADDLFGRPVFDEGPPPIAPANQKQLLFEDESEPELFASEKPARETKKEQDVGVKKPVGAMSLFGSNANAESIGAAILKRNQRHSSTSGEESDQEPKQTKNNPLETPKQTNTEREREAKTQKEKERDIFEDLFAKSERINKENNKNHVKEDKKGKEEIKKPEKKPDLFSDIFDDIDDIFTTDVKVVSKDNKKQQKSIFDDDDLFAEVTETVKHTKKALNKVDSRNKTEIFADEDDIFSDKLPEIKNESKDVKNKSIKETKTLFDDSDDDLFSVVDKTNKNVMSVNVAKSEFTSNTTPESIKTKNVEKGLFSDDDDLFKNTSRSKPSIEERKIIKDSKISSTEIKIDTEVSKQSSKEEKDLFSKDDDLFKTENNTIPAIKRNVDKDLSKTSTKENKIEAETTIQPSKVVMSPDIFDEDDDGLFLFQSTQSVSKAKQDSVKTSQSNKDLVENKSSEGSKQIDTSPNIKENLKEEDVMSKSTKSLFSDDDTDDDIFSKPLKSKKENEVNSNNAKEVTANRSIKETVINSNDDETKGLNNLNQTIIETTISTTKPKVSDKPVPADVTVINTKITVVPNYDTDSLSAQDAVTADTTVIDSKITVIPDIYSVTAPNVTVNEIHVSTKPGIPQKPIVAKKLLQNEELSQEKNIDDKKKVIHTDEVPITNKEKSHNPLETKTDLFDDIFNDQPPIFEKPKEPKKSKNVNALFDDDSDDESLFFKKNDVIPDERPEGFVSNDDKLFGLFMDEPPAIDVDFVQKPSKTDRLPKTDENSSQKDSQVDPTTPKIKTTARKDAASEEAIKIDDDDDDIFGSKISKKVTDDLDTNTKDLFSNITGDIFKNPSVDNEDDLFKTHKVDDNKSVFGEEKQSVSKTNNSENIGITDNASTEPKKVGKLKPMNLNINVNTLLPGASPKKVVKSSDNTDGQTSSRSNDELYINDAETKNTEIEPTLVKSVSFEGNPDSSVLDNKVSKERAKIQVKRRPSTRRARREAVKKSGIDFGEDSTDNSSSIDDQSKINKEIPNSEKVCAKNETIDFEDDSTSDKDVNIPNAEKDAIINVANSNDNVTSEDLKLQSAESKENEVLESRAKSIFDSDDDVDKFEDEIKETKKDKTLEQERVYKPLAETTSDVKDVKSKVVYILNDEDIFDTKSDRKSEASESTSKLVSNTNTEIIFSDPDDLFKSTVKNEGIKTLGQVYDSKPKTQKLDFLSDSDDDNLFKSSKTVKEVKPVEKKPVSVDTQVEVKNVTLKSKTRKSTFDDSDDDLFKGKTQEKSKKMPSLFGSDSDEELFSGVKKEKEVPQRKQEAKKEETRKQVKRASLFEDDGDDNLFGVKTKKIEESKLQVAVTKKKEEVGKQPEPVFADPLSLLDSDED